MTVRNAWCFAWIGAALLCVSSPASSQTYFAGTVVDASNQPLAGATIQAGHVTFPIFGQFIQDGQATTNAQGQYAISTLGAGDGSGNYVLIAQLAGHISEVYPDTPCIYSCPGNLPPTLTAPNLAADFTLFRPGSISGHVAQAVSNTAITGAIVVLRKQGVVVTNTTTNSAGDFVFSTLFPAQYTLSAETYLVSDLLPQVYAGHDYDITLDMPAGDAVNLTEGQNLTGVDFALNIGGAIQGSISSALNGAPLQSIASVRRLTPVDSGATFLRGALSGGYADPVWGAYRICPLLPGTFEVGFGGDNAFVAQFYPDAGSEGQAQTIAVSGTQTISGIDAHLTPLQTIAGTVTDAATAQPLAGALVHSGQLIGISLAEAAAAAVTDASGHYVLQGLVPSPSQQLGYYVWVYSLPGYLDTYYPNVPASCCPYVPGGAQRVELAASQQVTAIDLALSAGAYATGRIYDADTGYSAPAGMQVDLLDSSGNTVGDVRTNSSGHYTTDGVPIGNYYLVTGFANTSMYYPSYVCTYPNCQLSNAQLLDFSANQKYDNLDFAVPHLDLVFRSGFEQ